MGVSGLHRGAPPKLMRQTCARQTRNNNNNNSTGHHERSGLATLIILAANATSARAKAATKANSARQAPIEQSLAVLGAPEPC